ncbi:hypothetical protein KL907_002582 [Ogataea polymorpha]|nr:hypothetical protein KL907_002582 [Ogataea polymorpha]
MRFAKQTFVLLLFGVHVFGGLIPPKVMKPFNHKVRPQNKNSATEFLNEHQDIPQFNIYSSEMSHYSNSFDKAKSSGILITKETMNQEHFRKFGLKKVADVARSFDVGGLYPDSEVQPVAFPPDTRALFLLNTQAEKQNTDGSNLLLSVPFDIHKGYQLVDYSLLLPFKYLKLRNDLASFLGTSAKEQKQGVLYYNGNTKLEISRPVFIMVFAENPEQSKSTFFDIFAKRWIKFLGSFDLTHSVFCSVKDQISNTCVSINNDGNAINVQPTFSNSQIGFNHLFSTLQRTQKRDVKKSALQPQFRQFATFANFSRLNTNNPDDPFKAVKIQVSDPGLQSNKENYKNGSSCNSIDQNGNEVNNSTKLPDVSMKDLYPSVSPKSNQPRSAQYSQVIFPQLSKYSKRSLEHYFPTLG